MIQEDLISAYTKRLGSLNVNSNIVLSNVLSAINQVFSSNSVSGELTASNLSVRYVTADEFHDLLGGDTSAYFEPKTLYVVSSDQLNAYNERILSVADPEDRTDAANKEYVDNGLSNKIAASDLHLTYENQHIILSAKEQNVGDIDCADFIKDGMLSNVELCGNQMVFTFNADTPTPSISVALSDFIDETQYWKKSETSSASEISNALLAKQDSLTDVQMSAIDSVVDERQTVVKYQDGTTSSFNIVGEIEEDTIPDKTNAVEVKIGNTVTSIRSYAFDSCTGLTSVTIPNGVMSIGMFAFDGCWGLSSMSIPNSVTSIGDSAFYYCDSLKSVTIPNSVTSIRDFAFEGCSSLTSVTFIGKTLEQVQNIEDGNGNKLYPWGIEDTSIITTWNDASQEWVEGQGYLSSIPNTYKTYFDTISALSSDGYVTTTQLSTAFSGKADVGDLRYSFVNVSEWAFSGEQYNPNSNYSITITENDDVWIYNLYDDGIDVDVVVLDTPDATYLVFEQAGIIANKTGYVLVDRAVNSLSVDSAISATLPEAYDGKSRDLYLKIIVTGGSHDVSFLPLGMTYTGYGNPGKTYSEGTYLLHFRETSLCEFCVTDMFTDATLYVEGVAADAKAVGSALRSGFTEWVCDSVSEGYEFVKCEWVKEQGMSDYAWKVSFANTSTPLPIPPIVVAIIADSTHDAVSLSLADSTLSFSLSRHLITPTKTSQLTNDSGFTALSEEQLASIRSSIPADLEEVEYVEFTGSQYVDLGFKANQGTIKIDFVITPQTLSPWPSGVNQTYYALLGSRSSTVGQSPSGSICNVFLARNGTLRPDMVCGKAYDPPIPLPFGVTYRIILERGTAIVVGTYTNTAVDTTTGPQEDQSVSFFLGYMNEQVSSGTAFAKYCGYWGPTRIYQSGVLFMDLVPVRKYVTGVYEGFFYDRVSGTLFGGTPSALLAGPIKKPSVPVLSGKTYNFATNEGLYLAVSNIVEALGGKVTNFPTIS